MHRSDQFSIPNSKLLEKACYSDKIRQKKLDKTIQEITIKVSKERAVKIIPPEYRNKITYGYFQKNIPFNIHIYKTKEED